MSKFNGFMVASRIVYNATVILLLLAVLGSHADLEEQFNTASAISISRHEEHMGLAKELIVAQEDIAFWKSLCDRATVERDTFEGQLTLLQNSGTDPVKTE